MPPPVRRPGEVETSHALEAGAGSVVAWIMVGIGGLQLLHNIFGHEKVVYEHHVRRVGRSRRRRARYRRNPPRGDTLLAVGALALGYFLLPPRTPPTSIPGPRPVPPEEAPSVVAQRPSSAPLPDEEVTPVAPSISTPPVPAPVPEVAAVPRTPLPPTPAPVDYGYADVGYSGGGGGGDGAL